MENTGIAAAGEAGIGGEAGIIGTDRDGGAGGGRDGECGVGSGREEAGLWTDGISAGKPEVKGTGDQAAGVRRKVRCRFQRTDGFLRPEKSGKFPVPGCRGMACHKTGEVLSDQASDAPCRGQGIACRSGCRRGNQFDRDFIPVNLPDLETERGFISTDLKFNGDSAVSRCRDRRRRSRIRCRTDCLRLTGRLAIRL